MSRLHKSLLYALLYGWRGGGCAADKDAFETIARMCSDDRWSAIAVGRLERIVTHANDAVDALEDLARAEHAYKCGLVPCYVCGDWCEPDDIDNEGTCPCCTRWDLPGRAEADYRSPPPELCRLRRYV